MDTKSIISMTVEGFAMISSLMIGTFMLLQKRKSTIDRDILRMMRLSILLLLSDMFAIGFRGNGGTLGWYAVRLANLSVYVINYVMLIAFGRCLMAYIPPRTQRQLLRFRAVFLLAHAAIIMVLAAQFSDFLYYYDGQNCYHRGRFFLLTQAAPVVAGIVYFVALLENRREIRTNEWLALVLYLVIPMVGTAFQIVCYGYPVQTVSGVVGCWGLIFFREIEVRNQLYRTYEKEKKRQLQLEHAWATVNEQYYVLESMAKVYYTMHLIDLYNDTVKEFNVQDPERINLTGKTGVAEMMEQLIIANTQERYREEALRFTDLRTVAQRMQHKKIITEEFVGRELGWYRAQFIAINTDQLGRPTKVLFTTQNIDEEKRQREELIRQSRMDEQTGFYNRRVYEETVEKYKNGHMEEDLVYIALDSNGLKNVNDTLGHAAGDELIVGSSRCIREALGAYGRLYRTGGDEFVVLARMTEVQQREALAELERRTAAWTGARVKELSLSCGVARRAEMPEAAIEEMAHLADQRMYEAKRAYYARTGTGRE